MNILCLIPARKNSVGIKNKNLKKINKEPLVLKAIKLANKCSYFNKIVLSSDSKKILSYAKKFKKVDSFLRPDKFSKNSTTMESLVKHTLDILNKKNQYYPQAIAILQPTSPFRKINTINIACKKFIRFKPDALVSVKKLKHTESPAMTFSFNRKKKYQKLNIKIKNKQNMKDYFALDGGVIFLFKINKNNKYKLNGKTIFLEVDFPENIDIDNNKDLKLAKFFA